MPPQTTMSTDLRSILEGNQFDQDAINSFIQADRGIQAQVLDDLAKSPTPPSLAGVQSELRSSMASTIDFLIKYRVRLPCLIVSASQAPVWIRKPIMCSVFQFSPTIKVVVSRVS